MRIFLPLLYHKRAANYQTSIVSAQKKAILPDCVRIIRKFGSKRGRVPVPDLHFLFFLSLFILKEGRGGKRERGERENPNQAPHCQHRAQCRAQTCKLPDGDLSQNQELDAQPTEPPRDPDLHFCLNTTVLEQHCQEKKNASKFPKGPIEIKSLTLKTADTCCAPAARCQGPQVSTARPPSLCPWLLLPTRKTDKLYLA